jgi:hypothetical protein
MVMIFTLVTILPYLSWLPYYRIYLAYHITIFILVTILPYLPLLPCYLNRYVLRDGTYRLGRISSWLGCLAELVWVELGYLDSG